MGFSHDIFPYKGNYGHKFFLVATNDALAANIISVLCTVADYSGMATRIQVTTKMCVWT